MRKVFNALSILFLIISIAFLILPMGTLGLLAPAIALIFAAIAFFIAEPEFKKVPKWLLIVSAVFFVIIAVKAFMPSEVAQDQEFEQQQIESQKEDVQELENLEGDLQ